MLNNSNSRPLRQLFVTSSLPYANGEIHLGHLVEYIQTDIWVRFQRMQGHQVVYVGADDTHGTPIMLRAQKEGITPETLISQVWEQHKTEFDAFGVHFDLFDSTHLPENEAWAHKIYDHLQQADLIETKTIAQYYDIRQNMFLPDRFIKGTCPKCHAVDQYGDNCEVCGAAYDPTELINPYSVISGSTPELKDSEHYFFKLSSEKCATFLKKYIHDNNRLQAEAANKMNEWLENLSDWDISRDAPYFGFKIPNTDNKYFYVWLDAPIGYLATFERFVKANPQLNININEWLNPHSNVELIHFIGKDILYFHALFWPAMLEFSGLKTPKHIYAHGFLTVDGKKMSKSRGTFITAKTYRELGLPTEALRYYWATKLNNTLADLDLNLTDFTQRVNSDLVGKFLNIASRCAGFLQTYGDGTLIIPQKNHYQELLENIEQRQEAIFDYYENREFAKVVREVMSLCDWVNTLIDAEKPWDLAKGLKQEMLECKTIDMVSPKIKHQLLELCSCALWAFKDISIYLKPILPELVAQIELLFQVNLTENGTWSHQDLGINEQYKTMILPYKHLFKRLELATVEKLIEQKEEQKQSKEIKDVKENTEAVSFTHSQPKELITIDDFTKVDLRMATVLECSRVESSKKLLRFKVKLGNEERQIFSGIAGAYQNPELLIGKKVVIVANLAPRQMKFGISEGMIICASDEFDDKKGLFLLSADDGVIDGMKVS